VNELERVKPRAMFVEEAIQLALDSRWAEAVAVNRRLIEQHGADEEVNNRLGKALWEMGELPEALESYRRTLELNPLNIIAQKNVRKLQSLLDTAERVEGQTAAIDVDLFAEEPGKSALTVLVAPPGGVSVNVVPGEIVELEVSQSALTARTVRGAELGVVDTKLARRLLPLIETGNRYSAAVARVEDSRIQIMIREDHQAPENARKTSFPIARVSRRDDFRPYAKDSLLAAREADYEEREEDDEPLARTAPADDELEGMQTVEGELDELAGAAPDYAEEADEPDDEDARPEDSY